MIFQSHLAKINSRHRGERVEYAVLTPSCDGSVPLCLLLMGGGGSRQNLIDCKPLFEAWCTQGAIAPMILATPSAGMSYYVEDAEGGIRWESFLMDEFVPELARNYGISGKPAAVGISMGGYGVLKMAFAFPDKFALVAAMNPILEPAFREDAVWPRNRLHHSAGGPKRLIGSARDTKLVEANNPANRARQNADQIRESALPIFFEVGDNDFVNAHDGCEFLHRTLWDLDISHDYHLVRGADHGGPTFRPRMQATFAWASSILNPAPTASPEQAVVDAMRAQLQPVVEAAAKEDASTLRRFGVLPR